eukprot:1156748-Pelagomonas_calceolata.AAC.13
MLHRAFCTSNQERQQGDTLTAHIPCARKLNLVCRSGLTTSRCNGMSSAPSQNTTRRQQKLPAGIKARLLHYPFVRCMAFITTVILGLVQIMLHYMATIA